MSFLKKAWDWIFDVPPQISPSQCTIWAYAKQGFDTPPGAVLLAEYDNRTGYFTLTRGIMDQKQQCLRPLQPLADQPERICTRAAVIEIFDQLYRVPENIHLKPSDHLPHAVHISACYNDLKQAFAPKRAFEI